MDWTSSFSKAINFIENNLLDDIGVNDIAKEVNISPFYFQKGFQTFLGYSISEYIRFRRLYLAAVEIRDQNASITDTAFKYGYETVESFTKAFSRFHGCNPSVVRKTKSAIKVFLPLKIKISIIGGNDMDVKIEKQDSFKIIGFSKRIKMDHGFEECPKLWDEIMSKYFTKLNDGSEISQAIMENCIGEYAVCIDNPEQQSFVYVVGGLFRGTTVPEGMEVYDIPACQWAKFPCFGPMPDAIQNTTTKIMKEWLPNSQYTCDGSIYIEWYSKGENKDSSDYESAVWIPVN